MKRIFIVISISIVMFLLTSCKRMPESFLVVGKNNDRMLKVAVSNETEQKSVDQMLQIPERMVLSSTDSRGNIVVHVNAPILLPNTDSIPTVRIRGRDFTQEEAERILAYFIGDAAFNDRYKEGYDTQQEKLIQWMAEVKRETDPDKREEIQRSIDKFKSAGIEVTDKPYKILPASKVFEGENQGISQIAGYAKDGENHKYLSITNQLTENKNMVLYTCEQNGYADIGHEASYYGEGNKGNLGKLGLSDVEKIPLTISQEDAKNQAVEALRALNIFDTEFYSCEEVWGEAFLHGDVVGKQEHHAYRLEFVRSIGDVLLTYTNNNIDRTTVQIDERTGEKLSPSWPYERIRFIIDDTGIVEFLWESPYEIMEQVACHTKLMPFEDIQDIFSTMILVAYGRYSEDVKLTFHINQVQLGLMRIQENSSPKTGLIVPVWDFFGTMTMESDGGQTLIGERTSHLTINAIDGSIIERAQGY